MLFNVLFIIKMEIESKIASDFEYNTIYKAHNYIYHRYKFTCYYYIMSTGMMSIREHIDELRSRILRIIILVTILTIFSMSCGIKPFVLRYSINESNNSSLQLFYPYPDP